MPPCKFRSLSRLFVVSAISICLVSSIVTSAKANSLDQQGTTKLAEITAFFRHSESCPQAPEEWSDAFTMLLMMSTPSEQQVEEQEKKALALRDKLGQAKWCQLYALEMQEAFVVYRLATGR